MNASTREALIEYLADAASVDDGADGRSVLPPELARVLEEAPENLAVWRRWVAQARALASLGSRPVPGDLEGRVVAALHSGHRQDRAVSQVDDLSAMRAPDELESAVRHIVEQPFSLPEKTAPAVLDRLVQEEVHEVQKSIARRMTARLENVHAPAALGRRLEALAAGRTAPVRGGYLLPVIVLMVIAGFGWSLFGGNRVSRAESHDGVAGETHAAEFSFEIIYEDIRGSDIGVQRVLDQLTGGGLGGKL